MPDPSYPLRIVSLLDHNPKVRETLEDQKLVSDAVVDLMRSGLLQAQQHFQISSSSDKKQKKVAAAIEIGRDKLQRYDSTYRSDREKLVMDEAVIDDDVEGVEDTMAGMDDSTEVLPEKQLKKAQEIPKIV
ncbi:hypothetical protein VTL71DRAFT_9179 [Oculimacula yallundae]|uniref:Uncharacterized protein n=1 Tax=Oculimacula yallundae TaxID=86028 RepID=A0ABR4BSB0_9HELO